MEDHPGECMTLFSQDGVLLKQATSYYINYINTAGTLSITEYLNSNKSRFVEWKHPRELTIDSDIQDPEWAVVCTVEGGSGASPPNADARSRFIKVNMKEIKSFKVAKKHDRLWLNDGKGETICNFFFQHGNCTALVIELKGLLRTQLSKRDKNHYVVIEEMSETRQLDKSFSTLNLFPDTKSEFKIWNLWPIQPYEATMEAFARVAEIVTAGPHDRIMDEDTKKILNNSITTLESTTATRTQDEYEVVTHLPKLPERKDYPRGGPLTAEQWRNLQDHDGKVEDIEIAKLHIFRGGVSPQLRPELWKYLLDYYPWDSTHAQRQLLVMSRREEYYVMKLQWKTMSRMQEENFGDYRERKSLIEKDVNRTDRTIEYFAGDDNPNLQTLYEILMTYVMYNFDLGYVQGMSDLLSPILHLLDHEIDAFWCFVGFMNKVCSNFDMDQSGMKEQLENLHTLVGFADPHLANYLDRHDSGNMFFCFRWLLVWFKRELSLDDVMRLWEVLWTGLPCQNFHLLICVAILETEKNTLIENNYGFTEILKHINDLSGHLDISAILNRAEGIYNQMKTAGHLTDTVRIIIGLPILGGTMLDGSPNDSTSSIEPCSLETVNIGDAEVAFERAISTSYM